MNDNNNSQVVHSPTYPNEHESVRGNKIDIVDLQVYLDGLE